MCNDGGGCQANYLLDNYFSAQRKQRLVDNKKALLYY